jgi:hypothetical protein
MPQVSPWHSVLESVYHDNTKCTTVNNIEKANLRQGTGGKRKCEQCTNLDAQGK